jgi:hypothetical protein
LPNGPSMAQGCPPDGRFPGRAGRPASGEVPGASGSEGRPDTFARRDRARRRDPIAADCRTTYYERPTKNYLLHTSADTSRGGSSGCAGRRPAPSTRLPYCRSCRDNPGYPWGTADAGLGRSSRASGTRPAARPTRPPGYTGPSLRSGGPGRELMPGPRRRGCWQLGTGNWEPGTGNWELGTHEPTSRDEDD